MDKNIFDKNLDVSAKTFELNNHCCVVTKNGQVLHEKKGNSLKPLLDIFLQYPDDLRGSIVADKIVGKAAASVLCHAGAAGVYSPVMSKAAVDLFETHKISYKYGKLVDCIENRAGTGVCPLEQLTLPIDNPAESVRVLCEFLKI